jgi:phosphoglycolate phosphatase
MMRMLLFDVDGTLIRINSSLGSLHRLAFIEGFFQTYNVEVTDEELRSAAYSGRTDRFIVHDVLKRRGMNSGSASESIDGMFDIMVKKFRKDVKDGDYRDSMLSGVDGSLKELSKNRDCILGLLTGNVYGIAMAKMQALGISDFFKVGGYGNMSEVRSDLVDAAVADAIRKKLLKRISMNEVYVVGDTKNDIKCAKEKSAVSVAVATGIVSRDELAQDNPDYLLDGLGELAGIISK